MGFPGSAGGKESTCQCRKHRRLAFDPWVGKIPWRRAWQPTPEFLPGKPHGLRSLVGYGPQGFKESDMTEATQQAHIKTQLQKHFIEFVVRTLLRTLFTILLNVPGIKHHIRKKVLELSSSKIKKKKQNVLLLQSRKIMIDLYFFSRKFKFSPVAQLR